MLEYDETICEFCGKKLPPDRIGWDCHEDCAEIAFRQERNAEIRGCYGCDK